MDVPHNFSEEEVLRLLDQTDAARNLIGLRGSPSFSGVKPVAEALDRADRGGALNTRELLTIADLLTAARRAKEYFNDEAAERTAVKAYNAAVDLAVEINDQATADLLGRILTMEEAHMDWGEIQRVQIGQMGLENYLSNQTA